MEREQILSESNGHRCSDLKSRAWYGDTLGSIVIVGNACLYNDIEAICNVLES